MKIINAKDVFFYILQGRPTIEIGGERKSVGPDHLIESPAKTPHCIYNETDNRARILVLKLPKPKTATRLL